MRDIPHDDKPGFVADKPEHCLLLTAHPSVPDGLRRLATTGTCAWVL